MSIQTVTARGAQPEKWKPLNYARLASIESRIRGKVGVFTLLDKLKFSVLQFFSPEESRRYRLCKICEKLEESFRNLTELSALNVEPRQAQCAYHEKSINEQLRAFVRLMHEYTPKEQEFYEYVIQGWTIISREIRYAGDIIFRVLNTAFEEQAKFLMAETDGRVTGASVYAFCQKLDAYAAAAADEISHEKYSVFLGGNHPKVVELVNKQKRSEKISDDDKITKKDVIAEIRARMLRAAASRLGEQGEIVEALHRLAFYIQVNPSAQQSILVSTNRSEHALGELIERDLDFIKKLLATPPQSKKRYTFRELLSFNKVNREATGAFVEYLKEYEYVLHQRKIFKEDTALFRQKTLPAIQRHHDALQMRKARLEGEIAKVTAACSRIMGKFPAAHSASRQEAIAAIYETYKLQDQITVLQKKGPVDPRILDALKQSEAKAADLRNHAVQYEMMQTRLREPQKSLQKLQAELRETTDEISKLRKYDGILEKKRKLIQQELGLIEMTAYDLTDAQFKNIFITN